jgi:beta-lactamase superfamily II metal-dependent hydrolase
VVERFSQFGTSLLETSKQGAIVITSDGETFFVD